MSRNQVPHFLPPSFPFPLPFLLLLIEMFFILSPGCVFAGQNRGGYLWPSGAGVHRTLAAQRVERCHSSAALATPTGAACCALANEPKLLRPPSHLHIMQLWFVRSGRCTLIKPYCFPAKRVNSCLSPRRSVHAVVMFTTVRT